ncbi:MAG: amino acid permease [Bryobacterales bacterium]|nr:amino acid permease [Bryobacterales bacterium]
MADTITNPAERAGGLVKGLGLLDATTIVMGSMIGSGIFIVSADIARQVGSPGLLLVVWLVTAILTLCAALSYGELAAAMPHAGGKYVYLREAYGPLTGFLYGWTLFLVIQTGTVAAVAVAFAKFAGVLFPAISDANVLLGLGPLRITTLQALAIAILVFLTWWNTRGLRYGAILQNVFTITKTGALLGLILLGLLLGSRSGAGAANLEIFWPANLGWWEGLRLVGVATVGSLFASDAWYNVTFTGEEVRNPKRNLPLALTIGVLSVSALYLATNWVYLQVLPFEAIQHAPADRVGTAAAEVLLGPVARQVMAIAIMISTFGCINGLLLAGARVYYAMSLDGLFFRAVSKLNRRTASPNASLVVQCIWASLLCLSGTYNDLLDYVIFAVLLFYAATTSALFVLRRKRPEMERPYKAIGYPFIPAFYTVCAVAISLLLLVYKPRFTWPGLGLVLLGIPVYYLWKRQRGRGSAARG